VVRASKGKNVDAIEIEEVDVLKVRAEEDSKILDESGMITILSGIGLVHRVCVVIG
jgi:hypothetical protein